jgi:carboxymethylenebutenolidase
MSAKAARWAKKEGTMSDRRVEIGTDDGVCQARLFHPVGEGAWPAVIMYMDAGGIRPEMEEMAARLASHGYSALLPDLYYRWAPVAPFDPATVFNNEGERQRLMGLVESLTQDLVMRDTSAFLAFLAEQPSVAGTPVGCVGYCMGGSFALSAAGTFPARVAAAAAFHAARLATDRPDSPHRLAPEMRARLYIGVAGIDPHFPAEEKERLEAALKAAGVRYALEVYPDVHHGFAVTGLPVYDRDASERHWERMLELFGETLRGSH